MNNLVRDLTAAFIFTAISFSPELSYIFNDDIQLWCKNGAQQSITDDPDYGNHYFYGMYGKVEVFCDHSNQEFKKLKNVKIGDKLTIVTIDSIREVTCIAIETMKVDSMGHIRDKNGNYMGDEYSPCVILYTCQGKDRLVTIWKED